METIRTFVAVDVKVEQNLRTKWQELKSLLKNDKIKWVDDHSLHLTLFFLGDTQTGVAGRVAKKLEDELQNTSSFKITLQGIGSFGHPNSPKVIWTGIAKSEQLLALKESVSKVITSFGFEEETRDFSPHFTLGHVKQMHPSNTLVNFIQKNKTITFQESTIDSVIFYRSELMPEGPIYTPIKTIKLLCP